MKKFFIFLFLIFFLGCSSVQKDIYVNNLKKSSIKVLPFKNLSQTPYAGIKAMDIIKGVLRSKGFKIVDNNSSANYFLYGRVIEWRYKVGIDGEPAVSVYIEIKDKNSTLVYSGIASKSCFGNKSLSVCAQEMMEDIF